MPLVSSPIVHVVRVDPSPAQSAPCGATGLQIRQVQRELEQLLSAQRDSPTIRLKVAEARQTLAALQALLPLAIPAHQTPSSAPPMGVPDSRHLAAPCARRVPPPLPPRPKAQPIKWSPHVRRSPVQQMRERGLLDVICE